MKLGREKEGLLCQIEIITDFDRFDHFLRQKVP